MTQRNSLFRTTSPRSEKKRAGLEKLLSRARAENTSYCKTQNSKLRTKNCFIESYQSPQYSKVCFVVNRWIFSPVSDMR